MAQRKLASHPLASHPVVSYPIVIGHSVEVSRLLLKDPVVMSHYVVSSHLLVKDLLLSQSMETNREPSRSHHGVQHLPTQNDIPQHLHRNSPVHQSNWMEGKRKKCLQSNRQGHVRRPTRRSPAIKWPIHLT